MKGLLQEKMPRVLEFNKENSLIFVVFNKLPSSTQRKLLDILLYFGKQYMQKIQIENPEEYAFLEKRNFKSFVIPLEIDLNTLFSILDIKRNNKDQLVEAINHLEEISYQKVDVLNGEGGVEVTHLIDNNEVKEIIKKYGDKIKSWEKDRIIVDPKINFDDDVFRCYLSPTITRYVVKNKKYTRINILVHTFLKSTYTINLYDILVAKFKSQKEMMDKGKIPKSDLIQTGYFKLEELQDMLGLKKDHSWRPFKDFNKFVLKPAIKEINKSNVTEFEIVEVLRKTKKRKVTDLAFVLKAKQSFNIPALLDENIILTNEKELIKLKEEMKKAAKETETKENNIENIEPVLEEKENKISKKLIELKEKILNNNISYMEFKRELLKIANTDICNNVDGYKPHLILRTNDLGHIELYNPLIDEVINFDDKKMEDRIKLENIRKWLFRNPDRIGDLRNVNLELEVLKEEFLNKHILNIKDGYYYIYKITAVTDIEGEKAIIDVFDEVNKKEIKGVQIVKNVKNLYNFTSDEIQRYIDANSRREFEELMEKYKENKDKLQDYLLYLDEEYISLLDKWETADEVEKEEISKKLDIISSKQNRILEFKEGNTPSIMDKALIKSFVEFIEKGGAPFAGRNSV